MTTNTAVIALGKLRRDRRLPLGIVLARGLRYVRELLMARLYLRHADVVGPHARTLARPRIENLGRMDIGASFLARSVNVPVELGTGPDGVLRIGDAVRINYGASIFAERAVTIGDRVRIGPYVMIADTDFHDAYNRSQRPPGSPVVIEDDAWIGAKATVLKGVRVGRAAIVGIGSVVTTSVEPFTIVAGVPAAVIGRLDAERFVPDSRG
jgi:acetyltransferase-like isoleucine patch superfamily enzyme